MSKRKWESKKAQKEAVDCHPKGFKWSEDDRERAYEDHDGFFELWSHQELGISSDHELEITVGFLTVEYPSESNPTKIFLLPDELLKKWNLTEDRILDWANSWWTQGNKKHIPKFVLNPKPSDLLNDSEAMIKHIKRACKLVVELTDSNQVGSFTGRLGYSVFSEESPQLTLYLEDRKVEYQQHTVVHEFGHVLGLKHEHQRSDFWRGIHRFTDFNAIGSEQFSEREERKGVYDDYTTYDSLSVMHYFWKLEYFKEQYRQWFKPHQSTTGKLEIAKKRLNLEISATEEMVLMSMCDQLHKVKTLRYAIEPIKGVVNSEWVLKTQLESCTKGAPLPTKQEDIPEKGVKAWIKLVNGQKKVTIRKVEYIDGSTESGSKHICNDGYKFVVKPSAKDIKLVNWAYNTSEDKPPRPYSVPKPPPPVIQPIQPTASRKALFKIHLDPFDKYYGDLGDFKVIVISGNPIKYNLAPTRTQIPDKNLPKSTGPSKTNERVFVVHTEDASKLSEAKNLQVEMATLSVEPDDDDCYYIFIRLYAPDGKVFRDSATVPLFELKSVEKTKQCYENLKNRARDEIEVAMSCPQTIESKIQRREQLKKQVLEILEENIKLPKACPWMKEYQDGPLNDTFMEHLDKAVEFLFLFRGRNDLPFQLMKNIDMISSELKSDIALYKAAFEAKKLKAVEVTYEEHDGVDHEVNIPARYSKLRILINHKEKHSVLNTPKKLLFEMLLKFGSKLSSGKQFYTHEVYTSDQEGSNLYIIFLLPLVEDKDPKRAYRDKVQPKFMNEIGIKEVVQISHENKETEIYCMETEICSFRIQSDSAPRHKKRARKAPAESEQEAMLSLLSSMKKHFGKQSRIEANSGMESPEDLVLKYAPNWKVVAKDLCFSDERIERIESDYLQPERCLHVTIWKWLHNNKWKSNDEIPKPTVDNLKIVMERVS